MSGGRPGCDEAVVHRYEMGVGLGVSPIPLPREEAGPDPGRARGEPRDPRPRARRRRAARKGPDGSEADAPGAVSGTAAAAQTHEGERDGRQ